MGGPNRRSPPKAAHALLGGEHGAAASLQEVSRKKELQKVLQKVSRSLRGRKVGLSSSFFGYWLHRQ